MKYLAPTARSGSKPFPGYQKRSGLSQAVGMIVLASASHLSTLSATHALAETRLPTGSVLNSHHGHVTGAATTTDGKQVDVVLTQYDQWWLSKPKAEQAEWLDLWLKSIRPLANINFPHLTYARFMTDVMHAGITTQDLKLPPPDTQIAEARNSLPSYILSYTEKRCQNYRAGMSYDEGREKALASLSPSEKDELARALTLGSEDGEPTLLGIYLHALRSEFSILGLCGELAEELKKASAYN
mgnify:CR=1 FL=1